MPKKERDFFQPGWCECVLLKTTVESNVVIYGVGMYIHYDLAIHCGYISYGDVEQNVYFSIVFNSKRIGNNLNVQK